MTRATVALLHGDLLQVFRFNPFAIVYVVGLILMIAGVFGAPLRTPQVLRSVVARRSALLGSLGAFVTYALVRNLV